MDMSGTAQMPMIHAPLGQILYAQTKAVSHAQHFLHYRGHSYARCIFYDERRILILVPIQVRRSTTPPAEDASGDDLGRWRR